MRTCVTGIRGLPPPQVPQHPHELPQKRPDDLGQDRRPAVALHVFALLLVTCQLEALMFSVTAEQ